MTCCSNTTAISKTNCRFTDRARSMYARLSIRHCAPKWNKQTNKQTNTMIRRSYANTTTVIASTRRNSIVKSNSHKSIESNNNNKMTTTTTICCCCWKQRKQRKQQQRRTRRIVCSCILVTIMTVVVVQKYYIIISMSSNIFDTSSLLKFMEQQQQQQASTTTLLPYKTTTTVDVDEEEVNNNDETEQQQHTNDDSQQQQHSSSYTKIASSSRQTAVYDDNPDIPILWNDRRTSIPMNSSSATNIVCNSSNNNATLSYDYNGYLHIQMTDIEGGVGTSLLQLVLLQLQYASTYNLYPIVHLSSGISNVIDDELFSSTSASSSAVLYNVSRSSTYISKVHFYEQLLLQQNNHNDEYPRSIYKHIVPGTPMINTSIPFEATNVQLNGTGIWGHYFLPVMRPPSQCNTGTVAPYYFTMNDISLIIPGLHGYAANDADAMRCWRYEYLPEYITKPHQSFHTWIASQRRAAAGVIAKYNITARSYLQQQAQQTCQQNYCLGVHIRHSDKAAGRTIVPTNEFLPYVETFYNTIKLNTAAAAAKESTNATNDMLSIYIATDSALVIQEIYNTWPSHILPHVRYVSGSIRSTDTTPVFDDATSSHHRTNQEVLVDIFALSQCHFLLHGHSAVSEAAIWFSPTNADMPRLHDTSVNLEESVDKLSTNEFAYLISNVTSDSSFYPIPIRFQDTWPHPYFTTDYIHTKITDDDDATTTNLITTAAAAVDSTTTTTQSNTACDAYEGILHIQHVHDGGDTIVSSISSILNQIMFAEHYQLLPWIHIHDEQHLYDSNVHINTTSSVGTEFDMIHGYTVTDASNTNNGTIVSAPLRIRLEKGNETSLHAYHTTTASSSKTSTNVVLLGIFESYFQPITDFQPGDKSCRFKPLITIPKPLISQIQTHADWSIKPYSTDIPESILQTDPTTAIITNDERDDNSTITTTMYTPVSVEDWLRKIRKKAAPLVKKYIQLQPYISARADDVNPAASTTPCLGIHIRLAGSKRNSNVMKAHEYLPYMQAFVNAGGSAIYVATDTVKPLRYMKKNFPAEITRIISHQGDGTVRSLTGEYPIHMLDRPHRIHVESLVDVAALAKCDVFVHTYSAVAELVHYMKDFAASVNLEDPYHISPQQFELQIRSALSGGEQPPVVEMNSVAVVRSDSSNSIQHQRQPYSVEYRFPTVLRDDTTDRRCGTNAIVYLAQKVHSSYAGRNSYESLVQSMTLLRENYLSQNTTTTDVFVFHTGDFTASDVTTIEDVLSAPPGMVHLVNLAGTKYWSRPIYNIDDNPATDWYAWPLFSEGYRHMMHWFAIGIWDFFAEYNDRTGCSYRYLFRLDEDSFIHSPISYDIFEFMKTNQYNYGFRMCAYELQVIQRMTTRWMKRYSTTATSSSTFTPHRTIDLEMCGVYNNFFVADIEFFRSDAVQEFLKFIDQQGHIYRRRLGDLMIHSMVVYWFAEPASIHRFLDFTYEHGTLNHTTGCLQWGGMQAGYNDVNSAQTLLTYYDHFIHELGCNATSITLETLPEEDLSPTYAHSSNRNDTSIPIQLQTVKAGWVEHSRKGILSG